MLNYSYAFVKSRDLLVTDVWATHAKFHANKDAVVCGDERECTCKSIVTCKRK